MGFGKVDDHVEIGERDGNGERAWNLCPSHTLCPVHLFYLAVSELINW